MDRARAFLDAAIQRAESDPVLAPLVEMADGAIVLGALAGGGLFFWLGFFLGARNRGVPGAVVGSLSAMVLGLALGALLGRFAPAMQGEASVALELDEHPGDYVGGDTVSGYVRVSSNRTCRIEGGSVHLVCRGFYVHDETRAESEAEEPKLVKSAQTYHTESVSVVPAGVVRRSSPMRYPFRLELPDEPLPTHHGFGCSVRWTVHAGLEGQTEITDHDQQEMMVRASPALGVGKRPERVSTSGTVGELVLTLPRSAYAEGETLSARIIVTPSEDFTAREVRALMLRVEHNPQGDDHIVYISGWNAETGRFRGESRPGGQGTTYVWLEDELDLAKDVRLNRGEKKLYDVKFEIPQQWRPTLLTDHGDVSWRVVAVLSRPNGQDLRVHQGVTIHTGAARLARVMASPAELERDSTAL